VLSTFSVGTLITFGCALMYSVHQPGASIRAASQSTRNKVETAHLEDRRSPAKEGEKNSSQVAALPARNSSPDASISGSVQPSDERLPSTPSRPGSGANITSPSFAGNMASVAHGDFSPAALSAPIGGPQFETTPPAREQQLQSASTVGTAAPVKTDSTQQPMPAPKSPDVPSFAPEEKPAAPRPEHTVVTTTVERGTSVEVRLAEALSSDHNRTGDSFQAVLATPLVANGTVVAGEGSTVFGRIAEVHKARLLGGRGWLTLTLANIKLPDGRLLQVNTTRIQRSVAENPIIATTKIIRGAALGTVKGAFNGAAQGAGLAPNTLRDAPENSTGKGRAAVLPAGTEISFNLTAPVTLTPIANR
jgi:hypothetical protein